MYLAAWPWAWKQILYPTPSMPTTWIAVFWIEVALASRQAPPSRFGHVFVGIDVSSKLLIWGGSISQGSAQEFYMAHWGLPLSHCPCYVGNAILRHSTPFSLICAMVLHATPSCYLLLFTTTCGNDHEQNMWVRQSNCNLVVCLFVF